MQIKDSYFCKYPNGTAIWYSVNAHPKEGYSDFEIRKILIPEAGKILCNKNSGETSYGIWLKDSDERDWEEIDIPTETEEGL